MVVPALIGAGASLLGGLFGKKKVPDARAESRGGILGQAEGAREAAKLYGFNPLTLLGASSPLPSQQEGANYMGAAVADAGMILADALTKQKDVGRLERAERLNEYQRKRIADLTLRPAVPGVYGLGNGGYRNAPVSSDRSGAAGSNPGGGRGAGNVDGVLLGVTPNPVAPGREKDVMPLPNSPGVFEVENAVTGGPVTIPGDSEPWGIDELATAVLTGGPQAAWNWGKSAGLELRKATGGVSPGERRRGPANTGKKKARNVLGMFPTLGPMPNPWFDAPW